MPTTQLLKSCLEACRAASLASHSAAGLVTSARKSPGVENVKLSEVARLLRSAEALARSATSVLASMTTSTSVPPTARVRCDGGTGVSAGVSAAKTPRRRRKKKVVEEEVVPLHADDEMKDVDAASSPTPLDVALPTEVNSGLSSPSKCNGKLTESSSSHPKGAKSHPKGASFLAGTTVVLFGLSSRKDLEGAIGTVIPSPVASDDRIAVQLPCGERVRVQHKNVKVSIFSPGFAGLADAH